MVDRTGTGGRTREAGSRRQKAGSREAGRPEPTGRLPHVVGRFFQSRNRIQFLSLECGNPMHNLPVANCALGYASANVQRKLERRR